MHYVQQPQSRALFPGQEGRTTCRSVSVERKVTRGQIVRSVLIVFSVFR
jgi:hypothetical protein